MSNRIKSTSDFRCHSVGDNASGTELLQENTLGESYKLLYCYEGVCAIVIDGTPYAASKGYSALVQPYNEFSVAASNGAKYVWLEFSGFVAAALLGRIAFSGRRPVLGDIGIEGFEKYFDIPLFSGESYTLYRQGGCVMLLMSYYIEKFPSKMVENEDYVFRACQYIDRHFSTQGFGVKQVVNALKIDRSYLYRLFKDDLGMSVIDYITSRRIAKAEIMLANSSLSVKDVSYSVGFSDQMYFSRVFKRINGMSPTAFRERLFSGSGTPIKQ